MKLPYQTVFMRKEREQRTGNKLPFLETLFTSWVCVCVCVCVCVYKMCAKNEYGSFLYMSLFLISSLLVEKTVFSYSPQ